ncbi:MAG: hypothetical protein DRJ10_20805 [Bacteroidetes bacterium]|nr:MAG: hypothetical protein DRJ10_20805 [Bacteroidota bacterium]
MPKQSKIYIKEWLAIKPYHKQVKTDSYYLGLCNKVKDALVLANSDIDGIGLYSSDIDLISCLLVSYFEDIISETNIWTTFVRLHDKMYGKKLPFYHMHEYFEKEINEQDIAFLLWYFIYIFTKEIEDKPFNKYTIIAASKVMEIFDDEYEFAPENKDLKKTYSLDETETDYYEVRKFIDKIAFNTYLFFPDTGMELIRQTENLIEEKNAESEENLASMMNELRDTLLFNLNTKLLSLKANEWAAEILGKQHASYYDLKSVGNKFRSYFLIESEDNDNIILEHIATRQLFSVTKKSIDFLQLFKSKGSVVLMGMANWKGEWWFSGISVFISNDRTSRLIKDERESITSKKEIPLTKEEKEINTEILHKQEKVFLQLNKDRRISFVKTSKLDDYLHNFIKSYNISIGQSGKAPKTKTGIKVGDIDETVVVFFNQKTGIELAYVPNAFPAKENSDFDKYKSNKDTFNLLTTYQISTELANYCIDNYKDKLSFFNTDFGKLILENSDFLLRFWKGRSYHSKP